MITDPLRIAPAINDGPNCYDLGIHGVINRIGEYSDSEPFDSLCRQVCELHQ